MESAEEAITLSTVSVVPMPVVRKVSASVLPVILVLSMGVLILALSVASTEELKSISVPEPPMLPPVPSLSALIAVAWLIVAGLVRATLGARLA